MNDGSSIFLLDDSQVAALTPDSGINVVEMGLNVLDRVIRINVGYRNTPATLADIVPLAQTLSNKMTDVFKKDLAQKGTPLACAKGCAAACCYQLIFLTVPEAFYLIEKISQMSQQKRTEIMQTCQRIAQNIKTRKHEYRLQTRPEDDPKLTKLAKWYSTLTQPCPFLCENACMIYELRPIICRDWLVTGSDTQCKIFDSGERKITMPLHLANDLANLASKLENTDEEFIILPCIFQWYRDNIDRHKKTYPAKLLVDRFIEIVLQISR